MATKRLSVKKVKRLMYDEWMDPLVELCDPVLADVLGKTGSGIKALMAAAPDEAMRKLLLDYEAEMNARTAAALRIGLVVGFRQCG